MTVYTIIKQTVFFDELLHMIWFLISKYFFKLRYAMGIIVLFVVYNFVIYYMLRMLEYTSIIEIYHNVTKGRYSELSNHSLYGQNRIFNILWTNCCTWCDFFFLNLFFPIYLFCGGQLLLFICNSILNYMLKMLFVRSR